jgi:hypothetical protein
MDPKHESSGKADVSKQLQEVTHSLAKSSGVKEEDVKKVLDQLGLANIRQVVGSDFERPLTVAALQSAVRKALTIVIQ